MEKGPITPRSKLTMLNVLENLVGVEDPHLLVKYMEVFHNAQFGLESIDDHKRKFIFKMVKHVCLIVPNPSNIDRPIPAPPSPHLPNLVA